MANPTRSQIHVNSLLRDVSISYQQKQETFIADKVFPIIDVKKQSDRYLVYNKGDWLRTVAAKRAPSTQSVGTEYSIDNTPTYFCDVWAVHHDIPDEDYDNADDIIDVETDATEIVTQNLLLRREMQWARTYMSTGVWQGFETSGAVADYQPNVDGAGYWSSSTANPAADIEEVMIGVQGASGWQPNTLVVTPDVHAALRNSASILDRIKYTERGVLTADLIAQVFGVERYFVLNTVVNTAQEKQPDQISFLAKNKALLCYSAPSPGLRRPSAGYIFSWTGRTAEGGYSTSIRKWRKEEIKATRVEGEMAYDMKQTGAGLGVLINNVLKP